jgi:hypothetical protein
MLRIISCIAIISISMGLIGCSKKYHCPACGVRAPAEVDACANCGFEFAPIDN